MGSAALIVHESLSYLSSAKTSLKNCVGVSLVRERLDCDILDLDLSTLSLFDLKLWFVLDALGKQEIAELTLVDLDHVAREFNIELIHVTDELVHLFNGAWSQTWVLLVTLDCESLTRAGLTVCEDANIVTINGALNETFGLLEYLILSGVWSKNAIEVVVLVDTALNSKGHFIIDVDAHLLLGSVISLRLGEWSHTAVYSDLALEVLEFVKNYLPLTLLIFELLSNSVKLFLLLLGLLQELILLGGDLGELLSQVISSVSFLLELLNSLEEFFFLILLVC